MQIFVPGATGAFGRRLVRGSHALDSIVNRMTKETRPSDQGAKGLRIARSRHRIAWPTRQEDRSWLCRRESARSKVTP